MQKEPSAEPMMQEENDAVRESQRVMKIKVFVTIAAVLLLVLAAILLWDSEEGYLIKIPTDEGETWTYEIADTSILKDTGSTLEVGRFKCTFDGLKEGDTEVTLYRVLQSDMQDVLEKRVYHVKVAENHAVMQTSVEREVYE